MKIINVKHKETKISEYEYHFEIFESELPLNTNLKDKIFLDIETTGLDYKKDKIFLLQYGEFIDNKLIIKCFYKDIPDINNIIKDKTIIGHNIQFDLLFLIENNNIKRENITSVKDSMIMWRKIYNLEESIALKELMKKYFNIENTKQLLLKQWLQNHKVNDYSMAPKEIIIPYAVSDIEYTFSLYLYEEYLIEQYKTIMPLFSDNIIDIENQLSCVVMDMKRIGVNVDYEKAIKLFDELNKKSFELQEEFSSAFKDININSSDQIIEYCQERNIPLNTYTMKGKLKMDREALEKLIKKGYKEFEALAEYREIEKIKSVYLSAIINDRDEENKLHANFNIGLAKSGRLSSSNPNLQNIPNNKKYNIRELFITPSEDYKFVFLDYSQVELRLFAYYTKSKKLLSAFEKGLDFHKFTASQIFNIPISKISKGQRDIAKGLNFGIIYGMGANGLAKYLDISKEVAYKFLNAFYDNIPELMSIKSKLTAVINQRKEKALQGYIINKTGSLLYIQNTYSALNMLIQSTAADILKIKMVEIADLLKSKKSKMVLTIHDELAFYIHTSEMDLIDEIKNAMEAPVADIPSLKTEVKIQDRRWCL